VQLGNVGGGFSIPRHHLNTQAKSTTAHGLGVDGTNFRIEGSKQQMIAVA